MRGSMRQRGDGWELRVYRGRDPLTGRKRWTSRTVHGGKREAERALNALIAEFDDQPIAPSNGSVGHLLNSWFENASQDFSPKTALEVRGFIDRNLMPAFETVPLGKLRTEDVDRFYSELRRRGGQNGKGLAPATVRRIHGILH